MDGGEPGIGVGRHDGRGVDLAAVGAVPGLPQAGKGEEPVVALRDRAGAREERLLRPLAARLPFLFIAGRIYGAEALGRFAYAVLIVEFAAQLATLGLKRGLAQQLAHTDKPHVCVAWDALLVAAVGSAIAVERVSAARSALAATRPVKRLVL